MTPPWSAGTSGASTQRVQQPGDKPSGRTHRYQKYKRHAHAVRQRAGTVQRRSGKSQKVFKSSTYR